MARSTTKKVGSKKAAPKATTATTKAKVGGPAQEEGSRKTRPVFDRASAQDAEGNTIELVNVAVEGEPEDLRLSAAVHNWTPDFYPLVRSDFVDRATYLDHRVVMCDLQIAKIEERKEEFIEQAKEARGGGISTKRKQKKLSKLIESAAELKASLEAQGIDTSDLMALLGGGAEEEDED